MVPGLVWPYSPTQTMAKAIFTTADSALNSPSNLSYSSGRASRTASTEPTPPNTSSQRSSPLLGLQNITSALPTTSIKAIVADNSNSLLDAQPLEMDRNPFQSVNNRRNKLAISTSNANGLQQFHNQIQVPHVWRTAATAPMDAPTSATASLAPANWRDQPSQPAIQDNNMNLYGVALDSPRHHTMPLSPLTPTSFPSVYSRPSLRQQQQHQQHQQHQQEAAPAVTITSHSGATASFPDAHLDNAYAYCYDRGNGHYARLIPSDMLPPLRDVPALQQGCAGMVVLPVPRALPPSGRSSNSEPVMVTTPPGTPSSGADTIQSRIDTIIASTPPTPTQLLPPNSSSTAHLSLSSSLPAGTIPPISSSATHRQHGTQLPRRAKIYCDKWVHEGVCAFTQQGCKYKHEMPLDKATQHQLGLFHGLPLWWKRHQAELARQGQAGADNVAGCATGAEGEGTGLAGGSGLGQGQGQRWAVNRAASGGRGTAVAGGQLSWRRGPAMINDGDGGGQHLDRSSTGAQTDSSPPVRSISAATRAGGGGLFSCSRGPISYGSPFGPIAPPAPRQASHRTSISPTRIPSSNPYASLETLEETGPGEERSDCARQV